MLRLDMNTVWTIVNLIVLYLLMKKFLIGPVTAIMEKRQALIDQELLNAKTTEAEAGKLKQQYEVRMQSTKDESVKMIEQARQDAKAEYDRIVADANSQAARIMDHAHDAAAVEEEKALREVESKIAGLVIAAAAKVVGGESSERNDQALYDKYITKAGGAHDSYSN